MTRPALAALVRSTRPLPTSSASHGVVPFSLVPVLRLVIIMADFTSEQRPCWLDLSDEGGRARCVWAGHRGSAQHAIRSSRCWERCVNFNARCCDIRFGNVPVGPKDRTPDRLKSASTSPPDGSNSKLTVAVAGFASTKAARASPGAMSMLYAGTSG